MSDVIWESRYWKEPLGRSARYLERLRVDEEIHESVFVRIEKEVFLGFYSVRRLHDTFTLTDKTRGIQFDLVWHPNLKAVDYMNWHHIDENYGLSVHNRETRSLSYLCNQFIHSFLFMPHVAGDRLAGFFVASDRDRHSKCYFVSISQVVSAFLTVSRDYPKHLEFVRDESTGQIRVISAEWHPVQPAAPADA